MKVKQSKEDKLEEKKANSALSDLIRRAKAKDALICEVYINKNN